MRRHPKFFSTVIFILAALFTFVAGVCCAGMVGVLTDSGMLGICGPYGPHADLVGCIFLGSIPAAILAGFISARFFKRRIVSHLNPSPEPSAADTSDSAARSTPQTGGGSLRGR